MLLVVVTQAARLAADRPGALAAATVLGDRAEERAAGTPARPQPGLRARGTRRARVRFVRRAAEEGQPIGLVNLGPTRGDALAAVKVEASTGEMLPKLAEALLRGPEPPAGPTMTSAG